MASLRVGFSSFSRASTRTKAGRVSAFTLRLHSAHSTRLQSTASSGPDAPADVVYLSRSEGDPNITHLVLNRPEARNAISLELLDTLGDLIEQVRFDGTTRALILRSSTPTSFCAGADLRQRKSMSVPQVSKFLYDLRKALGDLESLPFPTIAAIDGPALGGGLELALACDLRVAGRQVSKIGLPETKLAIIPGAGGTARLTRLLGPSKAKDLIFSGRAIDAIKAAQLGIIDHLAEEGQTASDRSVELAREIVPNGPIAIQMAKLAIDQGSEMDLDSALTFERQCYASLIPTKDRLEGLKAFAEKRSPVYKGE